MANPQLIFAEDLPYWDTTVGLSKSQEDVNRLLRKFGAESVNVEQAQQGEQMGWRIRMGWRGRIFRFQYSPFPTRLQTPIKGGSRYEQAIKQMGRRAYEEIKSVLIAAAFELNTREVPAALFGYMEIPKTTGAGGVPQRAVDLNFEQLQDLSLPALGTGRH